MARVIYYRYTLQAEAEVNRQGQWVGRGVVVSGAFEVTLPLTAPLPTPTAALDTILAAGRRWIDEQRRVEQSESPPAQAEGKAP